MYCLESVISLLFVLDIVVDIVLEQVSVIDVEHTRDEGQEEVGEECRINAFVLTSECKGSDEGPPEEELVEEEEEEEEVNDPSHVVNEFGVG